MPSFNDCIVVPFGLSDLAGAARAVGVMAYADGQYTPAMSAAPTAENTFFVAHSRNGKFVACLRRVLSDMQYPPSVAFAYTAYAVDVFDTDSWQRVHTIAPLDGGSTLPNAMVVSNTGVVALAASDDGVRVVDAVGQAELAQLKFEGPPVTYMGPHMVNVLEFSPAEDYLFVARITYGIAAFKTQDWTRDPAMKLDAAFYDPVSTPDGDVIQSPISWLKFSPIGDAVYFFGAEHGLRGKSWPALEALTLPALADGDTVTDLSIAADGQSLYYALPAGGDGSASLYTLDLLNPAAEPVVVLTSEANTFNGMAKIGLSLSADNTKVALTGFATNDKKDEAYGGAETAAALVIADIATGATEKSITWTVKGALGDGFSRFAVWLPLAKLQLVSGIIKDVAGAGVARTVVLQPREQGSTMEPYWTQSDGTGRFKVPVAAAGVVLNRIALDSTGTLNDLIDKVQV